MGVQKITFDGASVTSKIDADLQHFLFSYEIGILNGIRNSVSYTLANNTITFKDGYVSILGRLVYIEDNTQIAISPDSNRSGYVVLGVNLTNNAVSIYLKEQAGSYPSLTRNDISSGQGLFEFALCAYTKTSTSVTLNRSYQREIIYSNEKYRSNLRDELKSNNYPRTINPTKVSNGVYRISNTNSGELERAILMVLLTNGTIVTIPGPALFIVIGSQSSVSYTYNGSYYSMYVAYANGQVTFTCGSTTHQVNRIIMYQF